MKLTFPKIGKLARSAAPRPQQRPRPHHASAATPSRNAQHIPGVTRERGNQLVARETTVTQSRTPRAPKLQTSAVHFKQRLKPISDFYSDFLSSIRNAVSGIRRKAAVVFCGTTRSVNSLIAFTRKMDGRFLKKAGWPSSQSKLRPKAEAPRASVRSGIESTALWACVGVVLTCGVLILFLVVQVRDLKAGLASSHREVALLKTRLSSVESEQKRAEASVAARALLAAPSAPSAPSTPVFALSDKDAKLVRQFIKILPPKPGSTATIRVGDQAKSFVSAPIPDGLMQEVPKLAGARFSIDQNGSIVIISQGSDKADAILQ
jgi:hypothetical protein